MYTKYNYCFHCFAEQNLAQSKGPQQCRHNAEPQQAYTEKKKRRTQALTFDFTGDDSAWIDPFGNSQCATLCVSGVIHARQRSSRGWIVDALTQDDGMLTTTSAEDCTALLGRSSSTAKEVVSRPEIPHSSYVRSMYDSVCAALPLNQWEYLTLVSIENWECTLFCSDRKARICIWSNRKLKHTQCIKS